MSMRGRPAIGTGRWLTVVVALSIWITACAPSTPDQAGGNRNIVLITIDGVRWQEVFGGADAALNNKEHGGVEDTAAVRRAYLAGDTSANRRALMPFLWGVVSGQGQLLGNRAVGSDVSVTNGFKFSYPGYNEMLTGQPDPRIDRNAYGPNPNVTVFEWLAPQLQPHATAAFGTWDVFADIFNQARAPMRVHAGWDPPFPGSAVPTQALLDTLYATTTRLWSIMPYDAFMQAVVMEYVRTDRPQALYIGFGETDEWAHEGRYDHYLDAAHRVDGFIRDLWTAMQAMPEYAGRTTFIITTDHGRGGGLQNWGDHGADVDGAEYIWVGVIGPDTPALGMRQGLSGLHQSQVAATVAEAVGMDWSAASGAAPALPVFEARD